MKEKAKYWDEACIQLSAKDPVLKGIIKKYPSDFLFSYKDPFYSFSKAIIGQQISVKAADAIWLRYKKLIKKITAKIFLKLSEHDLKTIGFSRQKIEYLRNIAEYFINQKITYNSCLKKDSEELKKEILSIKGIGPWTYQMFEIFCLNSPDIFPHKDIGLLKAIYQNYFNGEKQHIEKVLELSETWRPYRTVATWYLWRTFDPEPIQY
jgi:DNA-3-methyladenine glycosylase II